MDVAVDVDELVEFWALLDEDHELLDGARMINLASPDAVGTWNQLEVLLSRWREIEPLADLQGPFVYLVSRTGKLRTIEL